MTPLTPHTDTPLGSLTSQLKRRGYAAAFAYPAFPHGWEQQVRELLRDHAMLPAWLRDWYERQFGNIASHAFRREVQPVPTLLWAALEENSLGHYLRPACGVLCLSAGAMITIGPLSFPSVTVPACAGLLLLFRQGTPYTLQVQVGPFYVLPLSEREAEGNERETPRK